MEIINRNIFEEKGLASEGTKLTQSRLFLAGDAAGLR